MNIGRMKWPRLSRQKLLRPLAAVVVGATLFSWAIIVTNTNIQQVRNVSTKVILIAIV